MTEDELTEMITTARQKFIDLGQEPLDGCSMERFIAREILPVLRMCCSGDGRKEVVDPDNDGPYVNGPINGG